jgi:hypothetical protein
VSFHDRIADLCDRNCETAITDREARWVQNRSSNALLVPLVELVDQLAFDVRLEDFDGEVEALRGVDDACVVFRERLVTVDLPLDFAAHVHAEAVQDEYSRHCIYLPECSTGRPSTG